MATTSTRTSASATGISKLLAVGQHQRSDRKDPKNRNDLRRTSGYRVTNMSDGNVRVQHDLGDRHGIVDAAEKAKIVGEFLVKYQGSITHRYDAIVMGSDEYAFLLVKDYPDPAVGETLRKAADALERELKTHGKGTAAILREWADRADKGEW